MKYTKPIRNLITVVLLAFLAISFNACSRNSAKVSEDDLHSANVKAIKQMAQARIEVADKVGTVSVAAIEADRDARLAQEDARHETAKIRIAETEKVNDAHRDVADAQSKSDRATREAAAQNAKTATTGSQVSVSVNAQPATPATTQPTGQQPPKPVPQG